MVFFLQQLLELTAIEVEGPNAPLQGVKFNLRIVRPEFLHKCVDAGKVRVGATSLPDICHGPFLACASVILPATA